MKIEVWCRNYGLAVDAKRVFVGDAPAVPRIGELVTIIDGYGSETVLSVNHDLYDGTISVEISPDHQNDYPEV